MAMTIGDKMQECIRQAASYMYKSQGKEVFSTAASEGKGNLCTGLLRGFLHFTLVNAEQNKKSHNLQGITAMLL